MDCNIIFSFILQFLRPFQNTPILENIFIAACEIGTKKSDKY